MEVVKTEAGKQGVELSAPATLAAGLGAHTLYSAMWGAIYGLAQPRFRLPPLLHRWRSVAVDIGRSCVHVHTRYRAYGASQ